jgi:hypothetical protein
MLWSTCTVLESVTRVSCNTNTRMYELGVYFFFALLWGAFRLSSHWIWGKLRYHALYDLGIMETAIGLVFGRGVLGRWCSFMLWVG